MIPNTYLHKNHKMKVLECDYISRTTKSGSYPWGRDWKVFPDGSVRYVNEEKAELLTKASKYAFGTHTLNVTDSKINTNVPMPIDVYGQESFL